MWALHVLYHMQAMGGEAPHHLGGGFSRVRNYDIICL